MILLFKWLYDNVIRTVPGDQPRENFRDRVIREIQEMTPGQTLILLLYLGLLIFSIALVADNVAADGSEYVLSRMDCGFMANHDCHKNETISIRYYEDTGLCAWNCLPHRTTTTTKATTTSTTTTTTSTTTSTTTTQPAYANTTDGFYDCPDGLYVDCSGNSITYTDQPRLLDVLPIIIGAGFLIAAVHHISNRKEENKNKTK